MPPTCPNNRGHLCLIHLNHPYEEAISILKLSTLYGLSDPRFIALLGGLYFCNGEFAEAQSIFDRTKQRSFTATELNRIQFVPPDHTNPAEKIKLEGKVTTVKAGYSIIECKGYPNIICPGSKFGETLMEKGLEVIFTPAFSAKSPLAIKPVPKNT